MELVKAKLTATLSYFQILLVALNAYLSGSPSFSFDGYTISAKNTENAPVHFSLGMAMFVLEEFVASGYSNLNFVVGSTQITIVKNS